MSALDPTIGWHCRQTVLQFFHNYDQWKYAEMLELFTADGVWHRAGKALSGRAAILDEIQKRPTEQKVIHVITNVLVNARSASMADASFYITVYRHGGAGFDGVPVIKGPAMVLSATAELVLDQGVWRFRRQELLRQFEFSAPA